MVLKEAMMKVVMVHVHNILMKTMVMNLWMKMKVVVLLNKDHLMMMMLEEEVVAELLLNYFLKKMVNDVDMMKKMVDNNVEENKMMK